MSMKAENNRRFDRVDQRLDEQGQDIADIKKTLAIILEQWSEKD